MKRILVLLMVLLYGASSSGMTVQLHFCCGKLDGISLGSHTAKCDMDAGAKSASCCNDQQLSAQLDIDQYNHNNALSFKDFALPAIAYTGYSHPIREWRFYNAPGLSLHVPPGIPLFVKNGVFRI
jgi:hypothetical protein